MILIGQYDSPFVRRVAVALKFYGLAYEHRPWSVFGDAEKIADYSPLGRVPVLVLGDGEVLTESFAILDALDDMAGRERALIPASGPMRRHALQVCAQACGLADKAVSLTYERHVHVRQTEAWVKRCRSQIARVLDALEADRAHCETSWWFGPDIGHADIAVGCALRFASETQPDAVDLSQRPALAAHAAACEAQPAFAEVTQPFYVAPLTS